MTISANKTIAKNTLFLYVRMLLTMGVTLYTSRLILQVLGINDYGIYSVVGGLVTLFTFINSAMSSATQRFLALQLGQENEEKLNKIFNAALLIHIGIALLVLILSETGGLWFLNNKLDISKSRLYEANIVFQFSILSTVLMITQVPFNALIIVREKMKVFALVSILEVTLKLIIVYFLTVFKMDKLVLYALLLFLLTAIITSVYKFYCMRNLPESRFKLNNEYDDYKSLLSYSAWNLFGNIAYVSKEQGINITLNLLFGTLLNAAYGIMIQVQTAINSFVSNFQSAINPQIYKSYGSGDRERMEFLVFQGVRLSYFMILVIVCPLIYNIKYIMVFWLSNPPPLAEKLVSLMLINISLECASRPLVTAALATGKIRNYQVIVGTILFLNLPLSYILMKTFQMPELFLYVGIALSVITIIFRALFLRHLISLNISSLIRQVVFPLTVFTVGCGVVLTVFSELIGKSNDIFSLIYISVLISGSVILLFFLVATRRKERDKLYSFIKSKF